MAANRAGYAEEQVAVADEADGSHTITFARRLELQRQLFRGEPYGGREVIFLKDRPVWMMTYYGRVGDTNLSTTSVYRFLRKALSSFPRRCPTGVQRPSPKATSGTKHLPRRPHRLLLRGIHPGERPAHLPGALFGRLGRSETSRLNP
jgi:hypothetical protein